LPDALAHVRVIEKQVYSRAGGQDRLADVYIQEAEAAPSVVFWLHGGGWRFGDRGLAPDLAAFAAQSGLALISIDYRLSDEAKFPAQVEDVKTAVRWARRMAGELGLNADRIGLWGSSAGGHLAACAALSRDDKFLTDEHAGYSSAVQAVVDGYGPTNFARIDSDRAAIAPTGDDVESLAIGNVLPAGHPDSFESRLLGVPVTDTAQAAQLADPVHYVHAGAPPFLILHGRADTLIPCTQSQYLFDALSAAGNDVTLVLLEKLKHGFFNNPRLAEENYGEVTVQRGTLHRQSASWCPDPAADIFSMVRAFMGAQLSAMSASPPQQLREMTLETKNIPRGSSD
jgi:acetyl esterase/lipase